jgi:hypothetical protein
MMWRRPLPLPLQAPCGLRCNDAGSDILTQTQQQTDRTEFSYHVWHPSCALHACIAAQHQQQACGPARPVTGVESWRAPAYRAEFSHRMRSMRATLG